MTLTTIITLNAALGTAVVYGLLQLLAHGIRSDHVGAHELARCRTRESDRIAACRTTLSTLTRVEAC